MSNLVQQVQNHSILIETPKSGGYRATALGLPKCQAKGATLEIALQNIRELLTVRLSQSEIVTLKIEVSPPVHPWMQFAGMFENDPQFEEVQADIQAYRQEIDIVGIFGAPIFFKFTSILRGFYHHPTPPPPIIKSAVSEKSNVIVITKC